MLNIIIDRDECTRCGLCLDACPMACLTFDVQETLVLVRDLDNCIVCRNCEDHCAPKCLQVVFPEWPYRSKVEPVAVAA